MPTSDAYLLRFRRVLEHIEQHLAEELSVEDLSVVAEFSKHHFHRQFSALFGVSVHKYVQLVRLKRASYQLAFRWQERILDIALGSGYESHEAFSRAFKKAVGQSPSEFREQPHWETWHELYRHVSTLRSLHMKHAPQPANVSIVQFPHTRVATLEHRGDPRRLGDSVRKFIAWRKTQRLSPKVSATYNLLYDNPNDTPPEQFRLDLCAALTGPLPENEVGIIEKAIPAGRCAVLRHVGSDDTLGESLMYLYSTWLPTSGEEPRDFPVYVQRVKTFPDVPEHEAISDVFLPLR